MSRDTWDPSGGRAVPVAEVVALLDAALASDATLTGLTVSGGEPLEQPDSVREVLSWLRSARPDVDSMLYTGWSIGRVRREAEWVLSAVDALVPEPFVARKAPGGRWRGSANQPMLLLSELGRARHGLAAASGQDTGPSMQVQVLDGRLTVVGIPRPGDLDRMAALAGEHGVELREVSWSS